MVNKEKIINKIKEILKESGSAGATTVCSKCNSTQYVSITPPIKSSLEAFLYAIESGMYDYVFDRSD